MIETRPKKAQERALLIGLEKDGVSKWDLRDSMEELRELANSAGAEVADTITQKLPKPTAPYYIGKGKAELIKDSLQDRQVTSVIFDDELSPAQGPNLETLLARKVLDRTRSEEHTSELQSPDHLVCRLLLEKKKKIIYQSKK